MLKILRNWSKYQLKFRANREKKHGLDWLATNTKHITSQSHSLFACLREKNRKVKNGLNAKPGLSRPAFE
jgi:hypothetical protein